MIVSSVELREIRLRLREPFRISSGVVEERRILLVHMRDADGTSIWSECVAGEFPNYSEETVDTAWWALEHWFVPRLLGAPLASPSVVTGLLQHDIRGHRMARAALEMGVWALASVRGGVPLASLLGGRRAHVDVGISIGIHDSPDALADRVVREAAQGYRRIKLKIAPGRDVPWVAAAREAVGEGFPIMADANNAYATADFPVLRELDAFGLIMLEQPLEHDDLLRHAALQRVLRTPVCLDESITSAARAEDMIALDAGRIINIKPGRVGGFGESIAIHDTCLAAGIPVWCGGMLESGIGRAYNVALASLPGFTMPGDVSPSRRYWERDVVLPEWSMVDGRIEVPASPGIGVTVDEDLIDNLTVRRLALRR